MLNGLRSARIGDLVRRFASFGIVGASGTGINLSIFWLLTERLQTPYGLAAPVAFEVAMFSNFLLNHHLTFRGGGFIDPTALLRYQLTALVGLAISLTVLHTSVTVLGIPPLLGNMLGIAAATTATFTLSLRWAWQPSRPALLAHSA